VDDPVSSIQLTRKDMACMAELQVGVGAVGMAELQVGVGPGRWKCRPSGGGRAGQAGGGWGVAVVLLPLLAAWLFPPLLGQAAGPSSQLSEVQV